ncbi:Hydantoinase/oxoprolinase [Ramaria rubella]|nr:Hydantoinase/oxoprolinase [Ramaria rubella]
MSASAKRNVYRIGVDVGGTNTDSVLLCVDPEASTWPNRGVLASFKHPTTTIVSDGIEKAIRSVLEETCIPPEQVASVMIGIIVNLDAVVEADRRRLSKVGVIRLGAPYTEECPPFLDFPTSLRSILEGHVAILKGGLQIDGKTINEIDKDEIVAESFKIREKGLKAVVIVGIYSPLDKNDGSSQEERARAIMSEVLGSSVEVVCSRDVGQVGLLERENAAILNASILAFARHTISGFQRAMYRLRMSCPLFLTQNDGTLISANAAAHLPIRTFSSGATNSMRGAAFLSGLGTGGGSVVKNNEGSSIIVVDIGGTTTDVGVLLPSGFPRQAAAFVKIGGVRTNFSMPDVYSIGLGGGSRVRVAKGKTTLSSTVTVGPDSTGFRLLTDGLVFGGSTLTATDIVVAEDPSLSIGDPAKVLGGLLESGVVQDGILTIKKLLEDVIDRMKTTPEPATVLLVGGGSIIAPKTLEGVGELIQPPFFSCANAVGACVANVAGELDTIEILQDQNLSDVLDRCKKEAIARAVRAGAKFETVKVVEVENLPVQYVTNKATRIIVKAVGELDLSVSTGEPIIVHNSEYVDEAEGDPPKVTISLTDGIDVEQYIPHINSKGEWILSEVDLEWIAEGCGILGTGGGGSPYPPYIMARQILRDGGIIRVISHDSLPDDAIVFRGHFMGSPSVSNERLQAGTETETACRNLARFMGLGTPAAIISDEIGGGNGIQPMILASAKHLNVPVFDGDLMGRAYPNMWQSLPAAYCIPSSLTPCAIADGVGNSVVLPSTSNQYMVETILRGVCTDLGSKAGVSMAPLSAAICRRYGVTKSVSQAWRIGRAVILQRQRNDLQGIPKAIFQLQNGRTLFIGKIIDVNREWGSVTMAPLLNEEEEQPSSNDVIFNPEDRLLITFQNENLTAELLPKASLSSKRLLAVVPDLITVLDSQSGSSLGTHEYRYGLRVTVLALAGSPLWTTPEGLKNGGPEAFGLDIPYYPVWDYKEPLSVIEEFTCPT